MHNLKNIWVVLALLMALTAFSQPRPALIPYRKGKVWGYCDTNKKIMIPCKYHTAFPFINGKAIVETKSDSAMQINTKGEVVWNIPYHLYDYVDETGLIRFGCEVQNPKTHAIGEMEGLLRLDGTLALKPEYENVEVLGVDSFEVVVPHKKGVINSKKRVLRKFEPYNDSTNNEELINVINSNPGDTPKMYQHFSEGMAVVSAKRQFGYGDTNYKLVIPCKYEMAESFMHGIAKVSIKAPKQPKPEPYSKPAVPPPPGFENAERAVVTIMEEGYIDKKGTEYWEDTPDE